jgi:hypothetical protein
MLAIACPNCGKEYKVPEERAGQKARCGKCKEGMTIPLPELADEPPAASNPAPRKIAGHWIVAGTILLVSGIAGGFYVYQNSEYEKGRAAVREHQRLEDEKTKKINDEIEWQRQVRLAQERHGGGRPGERGAGEGRR